MAFIQRVIQGPWLPEHQSNSAFAWLSMLIFFFWRYINQSVSMTEIILAALSTLVFLLLYFSNFWVKSSVGAVIVGAICLLGLVWAPVNPGASVFIVFSAASCASIQPNRYAYASLALILALVAAEVYFINISAEFWIPGLLVSSSIGVATIMQTSLRRSREKLIRSQEEVAYLATIAERERISRDLHDLLGHTLSLITIKAELAGKLIGRDLQACQQEIADIEQTARNALSEVRAAVTGYRKVGLTHELANAASCLIAANIELKTHIDQVQLSATSENILSLALREAITNVARHSGARQCEIQLITEGHWIVLKIKDNGTRLSDTSEVMPGNGLTGMRERVAAMGGRITMEVQQGLSVQVHLPIESRPGALQ
ncbi:two-component system sensor histidine kinase DesK [Oxalobacteraceae bacterium GrIS 2.11]